MEVPFYKKFLLWAGIIIGIFAIGIGAGFAIETMQTKNQANLSANALSAEINGENSNSNQNSANSESNNQGSSANESEISEFSISQLATAKNNLPGITLTFTGDIKLNGNIKNLVKTKLDGDYQKIFGAAKSLIEKADIAYGNFIGTFGANDSNKTEVNALKGLRQTGFDVLSMSYNGSNLTLKNLVESMLTIDGNGLLRTGAGWNYTNAREPRLIEKNGETIGYLAFSDNKKDWPIAGEKDSGLLSANDPQIEEIISEARAKSDILVVSFNWADSSKTHTLRQELLARTAIDSGASIVVGHYGSNLQDIEYYHGGLIAYNLGNLITGSGTKTTSINGLILETNISGGVINNIRTYGVSENKNGYIDSVNEISVESLIREKGVIGKKADSKNLENLPSSVTKEVVSRGPKTNKVAITIDDGWNPALVKKALDILSVKNTKATFFLVSHNADINTLNIIRAVTNGIELGNHTDSHGWLTSMSQTQITREIETWQSKIDSILKRHYETAWFRPPFMAGFVGHTQTAEVVTKIAKEKDMKIALWNIDPFSGISEKADAEGVTNYIVSHASQGSVILLHFTPEHMLALPNIIDGLRAKGLEPVTMSELMQ